MTRPAAPAYPVLAVAPDANYPAGSDVWSGNPTKVTPPGVSSVGFVPNQGNAAQYHNALHNARGVEGEAAKAYVASVLDWVGNAPALTFHTDVGVGGGALALVKYSAVLRKWLYCGGVDGFGTSTDILSSSTTGGISAGATVSHESYSFDEDASGNIVIAPDGIDAVQECNAAGVWSKHVGVNGGTAFDRPSIVFDPFSSRWLVASVLSGSNFLMSSVDRATWSGALSAAFVGAGFTPGSVIALGCGSDTLSGRIVAQAFAGTNVQFSFSNDGGTTWSAVSTFALGFTNATAVRYSRPVWNGSYWLAVAHSSGTASKVFKSTDGITWTNVATFAGASFIYLASMGELWIAVTNANEYAVSVDGGATWRFGDRKLSLGVRSVASNGSRFVLVTLASVHPGPAMGLGQAAVT